MEKLNHSQELEKFQMEINDDITDFYNISDKLVALHFEERYLDKKIGRVYAVYYYKLAFREDDKLNIKKAKYFSVKLDKKNGFVICKSRSFGRIKQTIFDKNGNKVKFKNKEKELN